MDQPSLGILTSTFHRDVMDISCIVIVFFRGTIDGHSGRAHTCTLKVGSVERVCGEEAHKLNAQSYRLLEVRTQVLLTTQNVSVIPELQI